MSTLESAGSSVSGMFSSFGAVAANYLQDKMLKKMDTDADGTVGKTEFQTALQNVSGKLGIDVGSTEDADAMFSSVDADGNGSLTGSEVGQLIQNMLVGGGTQAFVQNRGDEGRFAELDTDGDGSISMAEFGIGSSTTASSATSSTTAASDETLNDESVKSLMASADSDGDGQVSGAELTAFATKVSSQLEAASKLYNSTATASFSTSQLSQAA
jgi:Ca2+-binding EF-hand superfamily protein